MGQCYSISLHMKVKDGQEPALVSTLQEFTAKMNPSNPAMTKETLDGLVRMIFSGWDYGPYRKKELPGQWSDIDADFDASYSWERTMQDGFEKMAPFLEDGSSLYLEPDDDYYTIVVKEGKTIYES